MELENNHIHMGINLAFPMQDSLRNTITNNMTEPIREKIRQDTLDLRVIYEEMRRKVKW